MTTPFETPTRYVLGVPYCANEQIAVWRQQPTWGSTEQGLALIAALTELGQTTEPQRDASALVVVTGSGRLWYVIGVRDRDAVWLQTNCPCHAREMARRLFELATEAREDEPRVDEPLWGNRARYVAQQLRTK